MKRLSVAIVLVGWLLLIGYVTMLSSPPSATSKASPPTVTPLIPGPMPTARVPNELTYYTKRCWPACHYDPAWISEEPDRLTEEFEDPLGADWSWLNENEKLRSLEKSPGTLHITAPSNSIREKGGNLEGLTNVLAHAAPAGHFDILTKVTFDPSDDLQNAGLFVQMDDGSVISLGRGYCGQADDPACAGNGVHYDALGANCSYQGVPTSADTVCLMLRRAGNSYIGYYHLSEPGETEMPTHIGWREVGRCYKADAAPERFGLAVSNGGPGTTDISANFEIVTLVERK